MKLYLVLFYLIISNNLCFAQIQIGIVGNKTLEIHQVPNDTCNIRSLPTKDLCSDILELSPIIKELSLKLLYKNY